MYNANMKVKAVGEMQWKEEPKEGIVGSSLVPIKIEVICV